MPSHSPWPSGNDTSSSHDSHSADSDEHVEPDPWTASTTRSLARSWSLRQLRTPSTSRRELQAPGQLPWSHVEPVRHLQGQSRLSARPHSTTAPRRTPYCPLTPATGPHRLVDIMEQVDSRVFRLRHLHRHHNRLCDAPSPILTSQRPPQPQVLGQRDMPPPSSPVVTKNVTRYRPICLVTVDPLQGATHCELTAPVLYRLFHFHYVLNQSLAPGADSIVVRALFRILATPPPPLPTIEDYLNQHPSFFAFIGDPRRSQTTSDSRDNWRNRWNSRPPRWRVPVSWKRQYCFQAYFWVAWARFEEQQCNLEAALKRLKQGKHLGAQPSLDLIKEHGRLLATRIPNANAMHPRGSHVTSRDAQYIHPGKRPAVVACENTDMSNPPPSRHSNCSPTVGEDALSAAKQRYAESLRRRKHFHPTTPSSSSVDIGAKMPLVYQPLCGANQAPAPLAKTRLRRPSHFAGVQLPTTAINTLEFAKPPTTACCTSTSTSTNITSSVADYPGESMASTPSDSEPLESDGSLADSMLELSSAGTSSAPLTPVQCTDVNALGCQLEETLKLDSPAAFSLKSQQDPSSNDLGSIVAVTPIKPLRATKKLVGESPVLTPVRRSVRVLQKMASPGAAISPVRGHRDTKPITQSPTAHDKRIVKLLSNHGYAYVPNKAITIEPAPDSVLEAVKVESSDDDNGCGMAEENIVSPAIFKDNSPIKAEPTTEHHEVYPKPPVNQSLKHRRAKQTVIEPPVRRSPRIQKMRERQNQQ
ncbi:hypothetical protein H4R34_000966 [Dimargaris verticillata]|uniref:Uncharacterized protein n=1 Tax=Dimargaris verticillata TaxID=2761393 RepID=A0A9W8B5N6_9FUNG|nr:hypothetical protein H4R34_000966 [Dimargaris verticillata]